MKYSSESCEYSSHGARVITSVILLSKGSPLAGLLGLGGGAGGLGGGLNGLGAIAALGGGEGAGALLRLQLINQLPGGVRGNFKCYVRIQLLDSSGNLVFLK